MRCVQVILVSLILIGCNHESDGGNLSESQEIVYINDGTVQCESEGLSEIETAQQLIDNGIDVISSMCGFLSGIAVAAQCGLGDVNINLHIVNIQNVADAQELGFEPVSSLKRANDKGYVIIECQAQA